MQHFRAPTRLLDWSQSPYIGLYFAVCESFQGDGSDGCLWYFNLHNLQQLTKEMPDKPPSTDALFEKWVIEEDRDPVLRAFETAVRTDRINALQGSFTFSRQLPCDHATLIDDHFSKLSGEKENAQRNNYGKLIIPKEYKRTFLSELRTMNITASSLFPGLDGIGRDISELYALFDLQHRDFERLKSPS